MNIISTPSNTPIPPAHLALAREILKTLSRTQDIPGAGLSMTPLGGLTNFTYKLELQGQSLVLRIPEPQSETFIDRHSEAHFNRAAAEVGLSPPLFLAEPSRGLLVHAYINTGSEKKWPRGDHRALKGRLTTLKAVHQLKIQPLARRHAREILSHYLREGKRLHQPWGPRRFKKALDEVWHFLASQPPLWVPCHHDPVDDNFLPTPGGYLLVDWEYGGLNHPFYDLAVVTEDVDADDAQGRWILDQYLGRAHTPQEAIHLWYWRAFINAISAAWSHMIYAMREAPPYRHHRDAYLERLLTITARLKALPR